MQTIRREKDVDMRHLVVAAVIVLAVVSGAVASAPGRADWRPAFDRVNEAVDRRDPDAAADAWREAYAAVVAARSSQALLDLGDARLRIADLTGAPHSLATVRSLYRDGFFRARSERSVTGMRRAAAGFAALGDGDAAQACLSAARQLESARSASTAHR
jgi:hypothetical protein